MAVLNERRRLETVQAIFEGTEWRTAEQINALQERPPASRSQPASDWRRGGRIYSVAIDGREYFAGYQFDTACQPQPVIRLSPCSSPTTSCWADYFDRPAELSLFAAVPLLSGSPRLYGEVPPAGLTRACRISSIFRRIASML